MEFVNEIHGSSAVHLVRRSGFSPYFTPSLGYWNLVSSASPSSVKENFAFNEFWKEIITPPYPSDASVCMKRPETARHLYK
jgi:hypothetical protein